MQLMLKTETSSCTNSQVKSINNGTSSIPKTGRENQPRVNGIEIGASRLTLTSISFPDKVSVNISTILVEIL